MKRRAVIRFGQEKVKNITCHHQPVQTNHSELAVHFIDATGSKPCLTSPQQRPRVMITVGTWRLGHGRSKIWLFGHKKKKKRILDHHDDAMKSCQVMVPFGTEAEGRNHDPAPDKNTENGDISAHQWSLQEPN